MNFTRNRFSGRGDGKMGNEIAGLNMNVWESTWAWLFGKEKARERWHGATSVKPQKAIHEAPYAMTHTRATLWLVISIFLSSLGMHQQHTQNSLLVCEIFLRSSSLFFFVPTVYCYKVGKRCINKIVNSATECIMQFCCARKVYHRGAFASAAAPRKELRNGHRVLCKFLNGRAQSSTREVIYLGCSISLCSHGHEVNVRLLT